MTSFFARIGTAMGGGERLVAVTGRTASGLLRIVDVDARGNLLGSQTYVPANVPLTELTQGSDGFLTEQGVNDGKTEEIDWAAHEDNLEYSESDEGEVTSEPKSQVSSVSPTNPILGGFPDLQGE